MPEHTPKIQKSTASNAHATQAFYNKSGEGTFFPRPREARKPFFGSNLIQAKLSGKETSNGGAGSAVNNTGMPSQLKLGLEQLSGVDLSDVRVHKNSDKPVQLGAHAYAQGKDIHLGPGQEKHLPHEGWHVVQQMQGRVKPTIQAKGVQINDDAGLEREADVMGAKALQNRPSNHSSDLPLAPVPPSVASSSSGSTTQTIQRAMKFEYQVKKNKLYRFDGKKVIPLPRKFGPEDFLIKSKSGVRLESETSGQIEFETKWSRTWSKLKAQIKDAYAMTKKMNKRYESQKAKNKLFEHNGIKYSEFPYKTPHLGAGHGFKTNKKDIWIKNQKSGRYESNKEVKFAWAKVISKKLDVKKRRTNNSKVVGTLNESDKVKILKTKGIWSKIKKDKLTGWVLSEHIRPFRFGRYIHPGNDANPLVSRDTPLAPKERILVDIRDDNWTAYIQTSESFRLDQFDSYLKQFRANSGGRKPESEWLKGERRSRDIYNEVKTSVERIMRTKKKMKGASNDMKNFLLMVVYYIKLGGREQRVGDKKSAKFVFPLMSRTNFGSVFKSLGRDEQRLFKSMLYDKRRGLLASLGVRRKRRLLFKAHSGGKGPTIYNWLKGITKGKDLISGKGYPAALGRFRVEKEVGKQKGLMRFEARKEKSNSKVASKWLLHASTMFSKAMFGRGRDSGKGKTGLRIKKPKKIGKK